MKPWTCEDRITPTEAIEKIKARWEKAKKDLEEAQYIERLVFMDYVKTIKSQKTTWDYRIPMIKAARDEIDKTKKKERENISYIENMIIDDFLKFGDNKIKITGITQGGYEGCYWDLTFHFYNGKKLEEDEYIIEIPSRDNVHPSNIDWAGGKFRFSKRTSDSCITVLFQSYEEEKLAEQIKEYFLNNKEVDA